MTAFHRPPRAYPAAVPTEPLKVAAPPTEPQPTHHGLIQTLMPIVGGVGILGFAIVYGNKAFLYIGIGMCLLMVGASFAMRASSKRGIRKRAAAEARRYAAYLKTTDQELAQAAELQRGALHRLYPDPGKLWAMMVKRAGIWERRPDHADFLHVRLGTGTVPLDRDVTLDVGHNPLTEYQERPLHEAHKLIARRGVLKHEPVVRDLTDIGVLAVTGDRTRARAWARAFMVQLAAWRAPHDLRVVTAFAPEAVGEWEWGKWLPHQRIDGGDGMPLPALARSITELDQLLENELRPRLEQLRRLAEAEPSLKATGKVPPLMVHELVVIIDGYRPKEAVNDLPAFRELLHRARELKAIVVLLCDDRNDEPGRIDARIGVPERGPGWFELAGPDAPRTDEIALDDCDVGTAEAIARALTPLRLEEGGDGERGLAAEVRLLDLVDVDQTPRSRSRSLRVPIGIQADGELLTLDLKQAAEGGMGPHGVLVGATGSGKSELLRSLVSGLAATHDPESLSFVLVDFKGGAAFTELARLPHVAGVITNLQDDLSLVDRMRDALIGEQQRRQTFLRDAGNVDDVVAYRAMRDRDPSLPPLPDLLVIVDEFSELLAAKPEFIDLFVSIGRVGRSLGIHLLLSSQRLEEGRLRGLESHLRYRLCLRTYSSAESKLILGTPDAYLLPSLPGLGYLKVDTEVYTQFRAALASGPYLEPGAVVAERPPEVQAFDAAVSAGTPAAAKALDTSDRPSELRVLVDRVRGDRSDDAPPVHQVWLPPLPTGLSLDTVLDPQPWWQDGEPRPRRRVTLGRVDRPTEQRTEPLVLDLSGAAGHLAIVGAPRTGKSTLLRTLVASFCRTHTPDEVRFYGIDLGGGLLTQLQRAPHVGGVAGKLDREAAQRIVRQLLAEVEERETVFQRLGLESMDQVRTRRDGPPLPDVFLLVDGWGALRRDFDNEGLDREIEELAAAGLSFGIHVVVAANRWADIRPALLDNMGSRLELRINDPIDSDVDRKAAAALPADVPGRGLTADADQFQVALPRLDGEPTDAGLGSAIDRLLAEVAEHWQGDVAEPIRLLPAILAPQQLPAADNHRVAIGLEERKLSPVWLDFEGADTHLLVFGDAETGKSALLRHLARSLAEARTPQQAEIYVVDQRRALLDLAQLPHVPQGVGYATHPPAIADAVRAIAERVRSRLPEPGSFEVNAWEGPHVYLFFDDYDLSAGPTSSPLAELADLLALGRDIGLHVVLTRRVGGSARGAYEAVFSRLRELGSAGILMSGDPGEGPLLGSIKAQPQPPGRGVLVRRGERPSLVQLAFPGSDPGIPSASGTEAVPQWSTTPGGA